MSNNFSVTVTLREMPNVLQFAVNIPIEKGKIITKKKGHTTYVLYQYGQIYKPDKKYAVPQRTIIGKVKPNAPTTMYPNERFRNTFRR